MKKLFLFFSVVFGVIFFWGCTFKDVVGPSGGVAKCLSDNYTNDCLMFAPGDKVKSIYTTSKEVLIKTSVSGDHYFVKDPEINKWVMISGSINPDISKMEKRKIIKHEGLGDYYIVVDHFPWVYVYWYNFLRNGQLIIVNEDISCDKDSLEYLFYFIDKAYRYFDKNYLAKVIKMVNKKCSLNPKEAIKDIKHSWKGEEIYKTYNCYNKLMVTDNVFDFIKIYEWCRAEEPGIVLSDYNSLGKGKAKNIEKKLKQLLLYVKPSEESKLKRYFNELCRKTYYYNIHDISGLDASIYNPIYEVVNRKKTMKENLKRKLSYEFAKRYNLTDICKFINWDGKVDINNKRLIGKSYFYCEGFLKNLSKYSYLDHVSYIIFKSNIDGGKCRGHVTTQINKNTNIFIGIISNKLSTYTTKFNNCYEIKSALLQNLSKYNTGVSRNTSSSSSSITIGECYNKNCEVKIDGKHAGYVSYWWKSSSGGYYVINYKSKNGGVLGRSGHYYPKLNEVYMGDCGSKYGINSLQQAMKYVVKCAVSGHY